jgi:hypothetical protein
MPSLLISDRSYGNSWARSCGLGRSMRSAIALAFLLALTLSALPVSARDKSSTFKLGPEVLGTWCSVPNNDPLFMQGDCSEDDTHNWVTIKRDGWYGIESDCKIISGKIIGREAVATKTVQTNPVYRLKMRCYTEGFTSRETHTIVAFKGYLELH